MRRLILTMGLCLAFTQLGASENRPQAPGTPSKADFAGFVNWDFTQRKKLAGWKNTARVIERTIQTWYPSTRIHTLAENGTRQDLEKFLGSLPSKKQCDLSIVYLASHQSPAAEWSFPKDRVCLLGEIIAASQIPPHPRRIVILDACFASAAGDDPGWNRIWKSQTLFAASPSEETMELDFRSPQPVDMRRRYPAVTAWLNHSLGKEWNGKLSFLGFVWVQAFLENKGAPSDKKDWNDFMRKCQKFADDFKKHTDRKLASQIILSDETDWK